MTQSSEVRREFEKAFEEEYLHPKIERSGTIAHHFALWAAKWAFEKAAEEASKGQVSGRYIGYDLNSKLAEKFRQLSKELES